MKMSIADDRLEILIGKLLDGEISPAEQRLLDSELARNGQARELLEQLRTLHECGGEAVAREVLGQGADPEMVFDRAWQQHKKSLWRRVVRAGGRLRFAVGLAAGLILGLVLHFVLVGGAKPPVEAAGAPQIAVNDTRGAYESTGILPTVPAQAAHQITREVDWYVFTDQTGDRWLIEGVREGTARPVAYRGQLR
jgi:anti-sigma factor RsiW